LRDARSVERSLLRHVDPLREEVVVVEVIAAGHRSSRWYRGSMVVAWRRGPLGTLAELQLEPFSNLAAPSAAHLGWPF
jgi:hypothetical protein